MSNKLKFERVSLTDEINNIHVDGLPLMRYCAAFEIMLSFYDDDGKDAFLEWYENFGKYDFGEFCQNNEEYKWLIEE